MTGRREINMEVHRKNILLKVPTPVFVIPGLILFVVGMLLVILIWSPLNLWKFGIGLGANSISIMAGFLFAFGGLLMIVLGLILVWVESGYKDLPAFEQEFAGITLLVIGLQMIIQTLGKFNQQTFSKSLTKNVAPASLFALP